MGTSSKQQVEYQPVTGVVGARVSNQAEAAKAARGVLNLWALSQVTFGQKKAFWIWAPFPAHASLFPIHLRFEFYAA